MLQVEGMTVAGPRSSRFEQTASLLSHRSSDEYCREGELRALAAGAAVGD
jgi:hypothetical protein